MTTVPSIISEVKLETQFYVLFNAIQNASMDEIQLKQLLNEHHGPKKDETAISALEELASVVLPEKFGRLIATLDLQNAFLSLGKYVRNFGDADYVLNKLQVLIAERLANGEDRQKATAAVYELILCSEKYCQEYLSLKG